MRAYRLMGIGLLLVGAALVAGPCLAAQATAQVGATICPGLEITNVRGLEFGLITPEASGSVVVSPEGTRTASSGIKLLDGGGDEYAAQFAVVGAAGATYSVGLPSSVAITSGGDSMVVSGFVSQSDTLAGGADELRVGATLAVDVNQAPGRYTGWFEVLVSYN